MNPFREAFLLPAVTLALVVPLATPSPSLDAATVNSVWRNVDGDWNVAANWQPAAVPNNTPSTDYKVTIGSGTVSLNTPVLISQLAFNGGTLQLAQSLHTTDLTITRGNILGSVSTATIQTDADLVLRGGLIKNSSGITVGGSVKKRGYGIAQLWSNGNNGDYPIEIDQGTLELSNLADGSRVGVISITNPEFARLAAVFMVVRDDVYLNNARGFAGTGAFGNTGVSGDIFLGDQGAVLGSDMTITGNIHGGALELVGNGTFEIDSGGNTYTGATKIGLDAARANLLLRKTGRLTSTSAIELGLRASLTLENNNSYPITDRVPDTAPILSHGGILAVQDSVPGVSNSERFGALQLIDSSSIVTMQNSYAAITFSQLQHNGVATIDFRGSPGSRTDAPRVQFDQSPVLANSFIGPWATVDGVDFATYDPQLGVTSLGNRVARPSQINSASPDDHVLITGIGPPATPLNADHTIATLTITSDNQQDVDLGGHTLTLRDGGFIGKAYGSSIYNGRLTAGNGSGPATLYLHSNVDFSNGLNIGADIVDNPSGNPVSVVAAGASRLRLIGHNTYTGPTISEGALLIGNEASLPVGSELRAEGGSILLDYTPTAPKHLSKLVVNQGAVTGTLQPGTNRSIVSLDADQYQLSRGILAISLTGSGAVHKVSDGLVSLWNESPDFNGPIFIEQGILRVGKEDPSNTVKALGQNETTILHGGTLIHAAVVPVASYFQLDARLNLAGGDVGLGAPLALPRWDFNGGWRVTADSRLLLFDPSGLTTTEYANNEPVDPTVNIVKNVTFDHGTQLSILGSGAVNFSTGIVVDHDAAILNDESTVSLASIQPLADAATLHLRGPGGFRFPSAMFGDIFADSPPVMTVEIAAGATGTATGHDFQFGSGVTLSINGTFANSGPATLGAGAVLKGNGRVGDVINNAGDVAPGTSIGTLTVGNYQQLPNGVLDMELLGGSDPANDLLRARTASLKGKLSVFLLPGGQVHFGDTFDLLVAQQISINNLILDTRGFAGRIAIGTLSSGPDAGMQALHLTVVPEPMTFIPATIALFALLYWRRNQ